jgi:hypothetical protein
MKLMYASVMLAIGLCLNVQSVMAMQRGGRQGLGSQEFEQRRQLLDGQQGEQMYPQRHEMQGGHMGFDEQGRQAGEQMRDGMRERGQLPRRGGHMGFGDQEQGAMQGEQQGLGGPRQMPQNRHGAQGQMPNYQR